MGEHHRPRGVRAVVSRAEQAAQRRAQTRYREDERRARGRSPSRS
jgi:hypothetical protein